MLIVSCNRLEGIVSEIHLANLMNLRRLDMSENNLLLSFNTGWIPPFNLSLIKLRSCNLGSQFPKWLKSQEKLSDIDLSNVGISDTVPYWFWSLSPTYLYLNLSHNQLTGIIPYFPLNVNVRFAAIYLGFNRFMVTYPIYPPMW